jgi:hypothetical protein
MYLKEDLSNFNFFFIYFFLKGIQMKIMKILIKKKQKKNYSHIPIFRRLKMKYYRDRENRKETITSAY